MLDAIKTSVGVWLLNHVIRRLVTPFDVLGWAALETGTFDEYVEARREWDLNHDVEEA